MSATVVQQLMKDYETTLLRERRSTDRKPFVRPVKIMPGRVEGETHLGFSRDISSVGIGIVSEVQWRTNQQALLVVNNINGPATTSRAEVRWCKPYGDGWYLSGWVFR